jgi:CBS domain-containing protein
MDTKIIPDVVSGQTIRGLRPSDTALDAARLMREHDISAVVVLDDDEELVGIVTERDFARRVVAVDGRGSALALAEVMSASPATVSPESSPYDALEQMRKLHVRHLPVVERGRVVGMISMRDLRHAIGTAKEPPRGFFGRLRRAVSAFSR